MDQVQIGWPAVAGVAEGKARQDRKADAASRLRRCLVLAIQRRRQRLALSRLDRHQLDDIGLTSEQALEEARKPFWRR